MPRLKEVDSLQELANHVLLSSLIQCWQRHSGRGMRASTRLRKDVLAMRDTILDRMPSNLKADFLANLMNSCVSFLRDESEGKIILEMIIDIDIVGLRLTGQIVRFLEPDQAPRFRKLKELDLSYAWWIDVVGYHKYKRRFHPNDTSSDEELVDVDTLSLEYVSNDIGNFQLNDLTSIKYPKRCTDSDLEIIGLNCPNLEVLDICDSERVTDAGMRFLSKYPNLRVVKVDECPRVTHESLTFLLSEHKKLEEFSYGHNERKTTSFGFVAKSRAKRRLEFDMLSGLDFTLQCPYLTRFVYENDQDFSPAVELKSVVTKFPNLTHFTINFTQAENLSAVKHLDKLKELRVDFNQTRRFDMRAKSWPSLQEALTVIGVNLTSLTLHGGSLLLQDDVDFIFESCPNLEHLQIDHYPKEARHTLPLVIPSFGKLKELVFFPVEHCYWWKAPVDEPILQFGGDMLNLEILSLLFMRVDLVFLESLMLDNVKFPKLRVVKVNSVKPEDLAKIEQTAGDNNLDFCTPNDGSDPYYPDYRDDDSVDDVDYGDSNDCEFWYGYSD